MHLFFYFIFINTDGWFFCKNVSIHTPTSSVGACQANIPASPPALSFGLSTHALESECLVQSSLPPFTSSGAQCCAMKSDDRTSLYFVGFLVRIIWNIWKCLQLFLIHRKPSQLLWLIFANLMFTKWYIIVSVCILLTLGQLS